MNPRAEPFERTLARLTREEMSRSPQLREEYQRRHRYDWVWRLTVFLFAPLLVFTGLVMMPLSFTAPLQFPIIVRFLPDHLARDYHPSLALLLGGHGLFLGALACLSFARLTSVTAWQAELQRVTYFPVSDLELLRRNLWALGGLMNLPYLGYVLGMLTLGAALISKLSAIADIALILAIPLNLWHFLALSIVALSQLPPTRLANVLWVLPFLLLLSATFAIPVVSLLPAQWQAAVGMSLMALPSGWVYGATYYLAVEPSLWGLVYLSPLAATWYWAARWLRRGFSIREMIIAPDGLTPVFGHGIRNSRSLVRLWERMPAAAGKKLESRFVTSVPITPAELETKTARLLSNSWEHRGWVERLAGRVLSSRERGIVEQVSRGRIRWTAALYLSVGFSAAFAAVLLLIVYFAGDAIRPRPEAAPVWLANILMFLLCLLVGSELFALLMGGPTKDRPGYPPLHPIVPIDWREFHRLVRKLLWLRMVLWAPILFVIVISLQAIWNPAFIPLSCLAVMSALVTAFVLLETFGWMPATGGAIETLSFWRLLRLMPLVLLGFLPFPALGLMHLSLSGPPWLATLAPLGWLLMFASGYGIQKYAEWSYHHTELDFACGETIAPLPRRGWLATDY